MIRLVNAGAGGQPTRWVLAFRRTADSRLVRWLACGRYKHVSAFAYVAEVDHWVFLDWRLAALDVIVARGTAAEHYMHHYTRDADLLGMQPRQTGRGFRCGLWCVPAIKHLIGIRGSALRPDGLWRDCIRQGAEILSYDRRSTATAAAGPGAGDARTAGAE
jgi:hypothetical protein